METVLIYAFQRARHMLAGVLLATSYIQTAKRALVIVIGVIKQLF